MDFFCHVCYYVYSSSFFRLTNIIILQFFPHMFFPLSVMRISITNSNLARIVLLLRHFACDFESKCHVCYHGIAQTWNLKAYNWLDHAVYEQECMYTVDNIHGCDIVSDPSRLGGVMTPTYKPCHVCYLVPVTSVTKKITFREGVERPFHDHIYGGWKLALHRKIGQ